MTEQIRKYLSDGESYYKKRADKEIERNRKGDFEVVFVNESGERIEGDISISADLERIDFNFGANIFMLGEYDTEEQNRRYEEKFLALFNSAAVPLYWEGTEPEYGNLRYSKDTPHDVYRRPPADYVVEYCKKNGLKMKGHPLFWHEFIPNWLPDNYQTLKHHIVRRFNEISERYKDDIAMFDVVNEPSRIYDVYMRDRHQGGKAIVPEDDYCLWLFKLARELFPANKLILNDTVGASFDEFRGKYSGFYLNIKDLLAHGADIDEIGLQCHLGESGLENVNNGERLYNVLDTYASLGKTINISEISILSKYGDIQDEQLQADMAEQLYKIAFSHPAVTGVTWWNMTDDGILTTKRVAGDENMPSAGIIDFNYNEKLAYKRLQNLIKKEWTTHEKSKTNNGIASFRGFYGSYSICANVCGKEMKFEMDFSKNTPRAQKIVIKGV